MKRADIAAAERQNQRYRVLRKLGYSGKEAAVSSTVPRFCELVIAKGHDPSEYGELSWSRRGGRAGIIGPTAAMLRSHYLRELGADEDQIKCGRASKSRFEFMCRRVMLRRMAA